ncbi:MAG: hypothetical protein ETSY2_06775, partial [Candidatus Entotheonella gemina]
MNRPGVCSNQDEQGQATRDSVERLFRHHSAQLVSTLARIFGLEHLDAVEDAVQEAMVSALRTWPHQGAPGNPPAWLFQVARHQLRDRLRQRFLWDEKSGEVERFTAFLSHAESSPPRFAQEIEDDTLRMTFACCHPVIPREGQVALNLKLVGGFGTREIARAFLSNEVTIAQRIVRAKRRLRRADIRLEIPSSDELRSRLEPVLEVLYLLFNEGHSALEGAELVRMDLCHEAIRLCRLLAGHQLTNRPEVHALAALLLFQAARLPARANAAGELLLLQEQDRSAWDQQLIALEVEHLQQAATGNHLTDFHLEAEIAAHHTLADDFASTDWQCILDCYNALMDRQPSPVVALNRAVVLARVEGGEKALRELEVLAENE